jgi:hypothetical protein
MDISIVKYTFIDLNRYSHIKALIIPELRDVIRLEWDQGPGRHVVFYNIEYLDPKK